MGKAGRGMCSCLVKNALGRARGRAANRRTETSTNNGESRWLKAIDRLAE